VKALLSAVVLTACLAATARADVEIVTSVTNMKSKEESSGTMMMAKDRFAGSVQGDKDDGRIIFRGDQDAMYMINDKKKEYSVFDREMPEKLGKKMDEMKAQMDEALAKMPESQRAMAEKLMKKNPAFQASEPPERKIVKTGEEQKIGRFDCTKYDVTEDGVKTQEIWATPWGSTGLKKEDFAAFEQLGAFMKDLTASLSSMMSKLDLGNASLSRDLDAIDGVPIRTISYEDGKPRLQTTIDSIERKDAPEGIYDVNPDYKRKDLIKD